VGHRSTFWSTKPASPKTGLGYSPNEKKNDWDAVIDTISKALFYRANLGREHMLKAEKFDHQIFLCRRTTGNAGQVNYVRLKRRTHRIHQEVSPR